ncbi:MAG: HEAT repeat domain-containing protein [Planctomycetia bacterium]|nr:HEAT repeat domain-containing protein [Planctomycetia bacterium]
MLSFFSPSCPLNTWEKTWTETRMRWLADRLGIARLRSAEVVLPTPQFFPDPYAGSEADMRRLMARVAGYMGVEARRLQLEILDDLAEEEGDPTQNENADEAPPETIRVTRSQTSDPEQLVAALAREMAHELLLAGGHVTQDLPDHALIADLAPVYLGVGIFAANSVLREDHYRLGRRSWWTMRRQGHLPARIFGYAMALFAFARGEEGPPWAGHLRLDAASALRDGLRFLRRTGDTLFHPRDFDTPGRLRAAPLTANGLASRLDSASPSVRLAALWELEKLGPAAAESVGPVGARLADDDPHVAAAAAVVLGAIGPQAAPALPQILDAMCSTHDSVRAGAAYAAGYLAGHAAQLVRPLSDLLTDDSAEVGAAAVRALLAFGTAAVPAATKLISLLRSAIIDNNQDLAEDVARTLWAAAPAAREMVREHFRDDDDLHILAMDAVSRAAEASEPPREDRRPDAGGSNFGPENPDET